MAIHLCSLILAGGESRRFNGNKLLATHPLVKEHTLLSYTIEQHQQLNGNQVWLVGGAYHDVLRPLCRIQNVHYVHAKAWQKGQSESIRQGLSELYRHHNHTHWIIGLGDQPLVDASLLLKLKSMAAALPDTIIAASSNSVISPPVLFPRRYFSDLMALEGDKGAGALLASLRERDSTLVKLIDAGDKLVDIDTALQLKTFESL